MKKLLALLSLTFIGVSMVGAAPPGSPYNLGETLDPTCAPGDANCTVVTSAASGDNSDITSLNAASLGIGTTTPDSQLHLFDENSSIAVGVEYANHIELEVHPTANHAPGTHRYATSSYATADATNTNDIFQLIGVEGGTENYGTGDIELMTGLSGWAYNSTNVAVDLMRGGWLGAEADIGTVDKLHGLNVYLRQNGATVDEMIGLGIDSIDISGGSTANRYGVFLQTPVGSATNDYGIFQAGPQDNSFGGAIGVGTTDPDGALEVDTDDTDFPDGWGSNLMLTGEEYPSLWLHAENNDEGWVIGNNDGEDLSFLSTDGTSAGDYILELDQDGQMYLNSTTFTDEELHIGPSDAGTSSDTAISMENNGHVYEIHVEDDDTFIIYENEIEDHTESVLEYDGTNNHIGFSGAEAVAGVFWNVDNGATLSLGGTWDDASSRELKQDIESLSSDAALGILKGLEPVHFAYIAEPDDARLGFIAEDVPDEIATPGRKTLNAMDITAVLTKVVQEQQRLIEEQGERIERLEELLHQ